jgi:hypothetical protein
MTWERKYLGCRQEGVVSGKKKTNLMLGSRLLKTILAHVRGLASPVFLLLPTTSEQTGKG